ncbi:MAG: 50S ribosomal protein L17 [Candidatus Omnitrophota bacterium]|nr:MAG: 50S ribosomal protein L17 [Candidatus Omnitrophota bacterium]
MRHRKVTKKFSRPRAQRKALISALLRAVVIKERITTTEAKAKALRSWVGKLITWAKQDSLHHRRLSYRLLKDHSLVKRLFEVIGPRFKTVNGGYSRIIDLGPRKGDGALISIFELTKREPPKEKVKEKKEKHKEEKPPKRERKLATKKEQPPKKGIISGVRSIFKKERDAL